MRINAFARVTASALLLIASLCVTAAASASDRTTSDVKIAPEAELTEAQRRSVSVAVVRMLHHASLARRDIQKKDTEAAEKNVEDALTLVRSVDRAVPETHVATTIESKAETGRYAHNVEPLLVRLYSQIDEFIDLESSPEKSKQIDILKRLAPWPVEREGEGLTTVFFQFQDAKFRIGTALADLKKHDLVSADNLLTGLQHDVIIFRKRVDMTLERARLRLLDASRQATKGEFEEATGSLQSAIGALQEYSRERGAEVSGNTKIIISQVRDIQKKLEQGNKDVQAQINRVLEALFPVEHRKDSELNIDFGRIPP